MKENFPNLVKGIDIQIQGEQRVPNKLDPKRPTPRHITTEMPKVNYKEKILKSSQRKEENHKNSKRKTEPTKEFPEDCWLISPKKLCKQEGTGKKCSQ